MRMPLSLLSVLAALFLLPAGAEAGCQIEITLRNNANPQLPSHLHAPIVKHAIVKGRVKSKGGSWREMHRGGWGSQYGIKVNAGESVTAIYSSTFGCGRKRRYEFYFRCYNSGSTGTPSRTRYRPNQTDWMTDQNFSVVVRCKQFDKY